MENKQLPDDIKQFIDGLIVKYLAKNCTDVFTCVMEDNFPLWSLLSRWSYDEWALARALECLPKKFWKGINEELSYASFNLRNPELKKDIESYKHKALFNEFKRICPVNFYLRFKETKRVVITDDVDLNKVKTINMHNELIFENLKEAIAWRQAIYYQNEMIGLSLPIEITGGFWMIDAMGREKRVFVDWIVLPENISALEVDPHQKIGVVF